MEHGLWIEIDLGSENRQKFTSLVRNRLTLATSPQYEELFHTKAVLLCYVTAGTPKQTDLRLDNMLRWTEAVLPHTDVVTKADEVTEEDTVRLAERAKWASLFRFATVDYEAMYDQPHRLFTEPLWYKPDEPDPVPLFGCTMVLLRHPCAGANLFLLSFLLPHILIKRRPGNPKRLADFFNRKTFVFIHLPGQLQFPLITQR